MNTADEVIDRRQLRRKVSFWRIVTFLIVAVALIGAILFAAGDSLFSGTSKEHIARVNIHGVITNDKPVLDLLIALKEEKKVKAVILNISSPGGSTVGGESMYEAIRDLAAEKPVASNVGTLAASAGYMVASGSDHIVAWRTSIVGSIGVLFQYADASELLDKIGVKVDAIKSSPLKAEPNPFNPASEEAKAMIDRVVKDTYFWFVDIVTDRRPLNRTQVLALADGSVFSGQQALENGLIDAVGGEEKALEWLQEEREINSDLEVVLYKPKRPEDGLFGNPAAIVHIAKIFGIELQDNSAEKLEEIIRTRVLPQGLVSIWQAEGR